MMNAAPDSLFMPPRRPWLMPAVVSAVLTCLAILVLVMVFHPDLVPAMPATIASAKPAIAAPPAFNITLHLLLALAAVIVLGRVLSSLLSPLGQPPVIGEVLAGILLGPSLIGSQVSALVVPAAVLPALGAIAQLGVILYMFMVGLETNTGLIAKRPYATMMISHFSIVTPFVLGSILALHLYPKLSDSTVPFPAFALFLGIAMSITAFPVLARILTDLRLTHTELGLTALASAAFNDVTAWCLLALIVSYVRADVGGGLLVVGETIAYVIALLLLARPLMHRLLRPDAGHGGAPQSVAWIFVALLISTIATEAIGIHAIFGAFMLGAIIPHDSAISRALPRQLEALVTVVLLPAFFALTGTRTRIDLIAGADQWLLCLLILLVAMLGKLGGTLVAARLAGFGWRTSAGLGALMNTRGLMELIVLNLGLDLHVISPTLFSMMVLMTLVTTMMTGPLLRLLGINRAS